MEGHSPNSVPSSQAHRDEQWMHAKWGEVLSSKSEQGRKGLAEEQSCDQLIPVGLIQVEL